MLALTPRQRGWLVGLLLFSTILITYVASLVQVQQNTDAVANSFAAWHYAHTGSPFLDGAQVPKVGGPEYFSPNPDGRTVVNRTPGQIWAAVPFYYILSNDNFNEFSLSAGSIAASFLSALAMLLFFLSIRPRLPLLGAIGATAVLAFTTPVWSVAAETLWPHSLTIMGIAGAGWAASRQRWGWVGVFLGLGILARSHVAVIAAVIGVGLSYSRRSVRPAVMVAFGSGALLAVLLVWNRFVFGQWTLAGGYPHGLADVVPGHRESRLGDGYLVQLAGLFVSPNRGFLVWTPIVLIILPLVWRHRRSLPDWTLWLALGGSVYSLVQSALNEWTGGSGFNGYRLTLELLLCLAPCCAMAAAYAGRTVKILAPYLVGYQLAVITLATLSPGVMPETDFWTDNTVLDDLRQQPALVLVVLLGFGSLGWLVTRLTIRRLDSNKAAAATAADNPVMASSE